MELNASAPIQGLWCATLTPIEQDDGIDRGVFVTHVRGLLSAGVEGVVPFGTTGEGPSFTVAERMAGLEALLTAGIPSSRLAVATGCSAFPDTLTLLRHALQSGCPRCLVLPPFFWKSLSQESVFRFYASLIDSLGDSGLRLYVYHFPQLSAVPVAPETVARLASAYPGIVAGVKDSSGDFENTARLLALVPDLAILVGHEPHLPRLLQGGGAGTICGLANLFPERIAALLRPDANADDQAQIQELLDVLKDYPLVPAFKAIIGVQCANEARWNVVRLPLLPLASAERESLLKRVARFLAI
jgi:4-hydroxy-tetrahydrodipicolinate synthase